jgi:excisionase family DNA binding protein
LQIDTNSLSTEQLAGLVSQLSAELTARLLASPPPAPLAPEGDRLLNAKEMAARLGVHESFVRTAEREGRIPGHHIGRYVRFDPAEVQAALARKAG